MKPSRCKTLLPQFEHSCGKSRSCNGAIGGYDCLHSGHWNRGSDGLVDMGDGADWDASEGVVTAEARHGRQAKRTEVAGWLLRLRGPLEDVAWKSTASGATKHEFIIRVLGRRGKQGSMSSELRPLWDIRQL